jgi:hypothetical protein
LQRVLERPLEGRDDDDGVDIALQLGKGLSQNLAGCPASVRIANPYINVAHSPRIITVVVPSPTSSSCVRLSSIMLLAAGCDTSISRRMAWPSLVSTMPPMGSSSILSMALGPRHDRMISATLCRQGMRVSASGAQQTSDISTRCGEGRAYVLAAAMLDSWALRPVCLSPLLVSVIRVDVSDGARI